MPNTERHAGLRTGALLAVVTLGAGALTAAALAPVVGAVGVAVRSGANTFNNLPVQGLSQLPISSRILDSKGHVIAYFYPNGIYRVPVNFNEISPYMRKAIVAIEDARFWTRAGAFDLRATIRAVVSTLSGRQVQGGSDIAQQYIKNALELTLPTQAQRLAAATGDVGVHGIGRKIRELRMAAVVAHNLSKRQLLAAYLNAVPFFSSYAYGVQVAAKTFFSVSASKLTLPESALMAGIVNNPTLYNPFNDKHQAITRRNEVLSQMRQQRLISGADYQAAISAPLGLHPSFAPVRQGCAAGSVKESASWFCAYVLAVMKQDPAYRKALFQLTNIGGLTIRTTLNPQDQHAAQHAVSYMLPPPPSPFNPGANAVTEVLIQPGTGYIRAIAQDRPYGVQAGLGQTTLNYAVNQQYGGTYGVQTGSSSKIFTLLTALKQGYPFGYKIKVASPASISGYTDCRSQYLAPFPVVNAEGKQGAATYTLYNGTTGSINVFYATLEQRVGLCDVVKTAASLGMTRGDGSSLLRKSHGQPPADDISSFTLGSVNVSPMSMAAAYATVASRGIYCHPVAIRSITAANGSHLPVESARCHRVLSQAVADAANYIFQGVFQSGTANPVTIPGLPTAGKTGTADQARYVAFAGWTPRLVGYVSMFNPTDPYTHPMQGAASCFRSQYGALDCPQFEFGVNAGQFWQFTFEHADLGPVANFVPPAPNSVFFTQGSGNVPVQYPKPPKPPKSPKPTPPPKHP